MKDLKEYIPVVLFVVLNKVVPNFESTDEILKCGLLSESYCSVLFRLSFYNSIVY